MVIEFEFPAINFSMRSCMHAVNNSKFSDKNQVII